MDITFDDDLTVNVSKYIKNKSEGVGYIFEVNVSYPVELHDEHSDLPFLPVMSKRDFLNVLILILQSTEQLKS